MVKKKSGHFGIKLKGADEFIY